MNLITVENIKKTYSEKVLLNNVSFGINDGDKIGLIGLNGSGKSTMLKTIAGVLKPTKGSVIVNGTIAPLIANVRKMNDGIDVMFHENVDLEARDLQTDKNIVGYFELLGKNEIDKKKYPDLFFCNCNLGYRRDKYSGNMTRKILANDAAEIKSLIDIIEPENIICLGLDTSVVVIRTLIDKKFSCNRVSELIGTGEPYIYGETYIYPVAHPGYWGTSTRGEDNVIEDWRRIRK